MYLNRVSAADAQGTAPLKNLPSDGGFVHAPLIFSAVGDMLTSMEDQLESCGFGIWGSSSDGSMELLCEKRLVALASASRRDPTVKSLLETMGFNHVVEIFIRALGMTLAVVPSNVPRLEQFSENQQLLLDFFEAARS